MLCGESSGKTERLSIAVRHCSPPGNPNAKPRPRPAAGVSAVCGLPPAPENRPITGVRPWAKTVAFDNSAPLPLLSNQPATDTPLAWLVRYPRCRPKALLKASRNACGVNREGPIQLIAVSTAAASTAKKAPTTAAPRSRSRRAGNSAIDQLPSPSSRRLSSIGSNAARRARKHPKTSPSATPQCHHDAGGGHDPHNVNRLYCPCCRLGGGERT